MRAVSQRLEWRVRVGAVWADLLGLGLVAGAAGWAAIAARSGGDARPVVGVIGGSAFAFAAARSLSAIRPWVVPAVIVLFAAALVVVAGDDVLSSRPFSGPLGYPNADAAFYLQAAIAALALSAIAPGSGWKAVAGGVGFAFAMIPVAKDSTAATSLAVLCALGLVTARHASARAMVMTCSLVFAVGVAITLVLAASYRAQENQPLSEAAAASGLSERRLVLWHEAFAMMLDHPATGVGPGRFSAVSSTALADADARWAHNGFLQQGAEEGLAGFLLLVGLFSWGFWRLLALPAPGRTAVFGAMGLAALGIHASVDYILHFPVVPMTAAALLGAATSDRDTQPSVGAI